MQTHNPIAVAMTVAASDSGGGAGIEADLRTFHALGVYGTAAITALTSQNPHAVSRIDHIPGAGVAQQMSMVFDAFPVGAVKSGMLGSAESVVAIADELKHRKTMYILDPVMVSTSGAILFDDPQAFKPLCTALLPRADWITPNLHEAAILTEFARVEVSAYDEVIERVASRAIPELSDTRAIFAAAKDIHERFGCSVVLKGGHCETESATDIICHEGEFYELSSPRLTLEPMATHGTGCTFSAAFAAAWAETPRDWRKALVTAKAFVLGSLQGLREVSPGLFQMYPPAVLPLEAVTLKELKI